MTYILEMWRDGKWKQETAPKLRHIQRGSNNGELIQEMVSNLVTGLMEYVQEGPPK